MSFTDGSCPDTRTILTYSQSANPDSPYFADQTRMFSNKEWVDPPFCASEVNGNPSLSTDVINGCLPEGCGPGAPLGSESQGGVLGTPSDTKRRKCRGKKKASAAGSRRCHRKHRR